MDLKYDDLSTFLKIHEAGTFTSASKSLGLSQSALSQKIARIEEVLQATVFIRHPRSLELTASGEKLLIYAKEAVQRQEDFLRNFDQYQAEASGVLRVAGFSSIMRSLIIPKLAPLMRKHQNVSIEFSSHEVHELEDLLKTNGADFILTDYFPNLPNVESLQVGEEEYVVIESKKHKNIPNTYLDHGPYDNATESYFKFLGREMDYSRRFMGDVYSIVDGVALGLGRAVMSKHIVENDGRLKISKAKKRYVRPIVLSHFKQSYYTPLHILALEKLL